jgi:hypothetical protein
MKIVWFLPLILLTGCMVAHCPPNKDTPWIKTDKYTWSYQDAAGRVWGTVDMSDAILDDSIISANTLCGDSFLRDMTFTNVSSAEHWVEDSCLREKNFAY